jgi:hypothetical protein
MRRRRLLLVPVAIVAFFVSLDLAGRSQEYALVHFFRTPGMFIADVISPASQNGVAFGISSRRFWLMVGVDIVCWFALLVASLALVWKLVHNLRTALKQL